MKKTAVLFLAAMAVLTFLSRALDSITVTRVETGYGKQGIVSYVIEGTGEFSAGRSVYITLPEDMLVGEILKRPGQKVQAGDTILLLQMERLAEERESLSLELEKAKLLLEQETLSAISVPRVTEETLAMQQVAAAQRALLAGREDLAEAQEDYQVSTADLEHDYVQKKNRTREEVKEDNERAMKSARRAYEAAQLARDAAVKKAEREVEDRQKKLDKLEGREDAPEEDLERAQLELERAEEDLEDIRDEQDLEVEEKRAAMYAAEESYEDVDYGEETAREELRKSYEDAVKAEEDKLKSAEDRVKELEESLYQSMERLENAKVSEAGVLAEEAARKEISRLRQESMKLDIRQIEKKLEKIDALIAGQGRVEAAADGIVADLGLKEGDRTQAGSQVRLAVGSLNLIARIDKDKSDLLRQGTKMRVKITGQPGDVEAEVESVDQTTGTDTAQVTAVMPDGMGNLGGSASFTVYMESDAYPLVIPIEALREDNTGFFCLAAEPKKTILGEELIAGRINLEVLEKSSTQAAVSGPVAQDARLITISDKGVREGERVRVVDK